MARKKNARRNRGQTRTGVIPGPGLILIPTASNDGKSFWLKIAKPTGLPTHLSPASYMVTVTLSGEGFLLDNSQVKKTWSSGWVKSEDWKDKHIQVSNQDVIGGGSSQIRWTV
jgi:hypothetical protein